MPTGLKRYYGAGYLHFITTSCYHRRTLLSTAHRRTLFLRVLEEVRQRYRFVVVGYVVMPEHIHLLIGEPERANPSVVMQVLKQCYARRVLREEKMRKKASSQPVLWDETSQPDPIWQRRFYDFVVWTARKRVEKLSYMHRNPVKRGLVLEPDQWKWSSFRHYAYGEPGIVLVNEAQIAVMKIRGQAAVTSGKS